MRKTKIICTIGPACDNEETLTAMCRAGMNVARLNFSHGTHEDHLKRIELIRRVREKLNLPIAVMLDTKGPEYRIRTFRDGKVFLQDGADFILTTEETEGDESRVSVSYKGLTEELNPGDTVLINNGLVILRVKEVSGPDVICQVVTGGVLSDRKSMNFPNKVMKNEYLSEQDKDDTFLGKFFVAALAQKSLVTNRIFHAGNLLAGISLDYREKGFGGIRDYLRLVRRMSKEASHE